MKRRKILTLIVMIDVVVVIYIILTSTIIHYRSEEKVADVLIESFKEWGLKSTDERIKFIQRESELVVPDPAMAQKLSGKILLQVEGKGEAWYVNPIDLKKYYLGKPSDIATLITVLGIAITNEELVQYIYFDKIFPERLWGKLVYDENKKSDAYYVDPENGEAYALGQPDDAIELMREKGLGVNNKNIRKIEVGVLGE